MNKFIKILVFLLTILGFIYLSNNDLEITEYQIIDSKIPSDFNDYKIVQISDYHNVSSKLLNKSIITKIEEIAPDIIVITGDLIDSSSTNINQALALIDEIKKIAPIYYVTGNHETWTEEYNELKEELEQEYIKVLTNETIIINHKSSSINLIGIEDSIDSDSFKKNLESTMYDQSLYSILLSHRAELFSDYVEYDINLVLTGHAHGGQIRLFNQGLISPDQGLFPKYTSGIYQEAKTTMITSRGIGNSIIPIRLNNHPELILVTLNNK